jgi:hypothetical protein
MSRNYKFRNQEKLYFVTFSVILWIDVFMGDRLFQNTGYYVHWANQAESLSNYYHKLRKAKLAAGVSLLISASTLICAWPPGVFLISSIRQLATEIGAVNISCAFRDTLHISLTISYPRSINQHFKLAYKTWNQYWDRHKTK